MEPLLSIEGLQISLRDPDKGGEGAVVRGVDLRLGKGERLSLVGESGCGKSMTALSILGLLPSPPMVLTGGRILFKGQDLGKCSAGDWGKIRGAEIGIVFQEPVTSLNPVMTVGEQIEEVIQLHSGSEDPAARVLELLGEVGLSDAPRVARQYPHQLSGGMCQRVMIAMAIACGPSLLIADEPTTALDVTVQAQILDLLARETSRRGMAVLLITHDLRIAREYSDRVVILYAGKVVEEGSPEAIFDHPQHPYTEGLLAALPRYSAKGRELASIVGNVPTPFAFFTGCAFADRCPRVADKCRKSEPWLEETGEGHKARCFYPSKS